MTPRSPHKTFVFNWIKALLLSPGLLFPAAYMVYYLSTNVYLNAGFKANLASSFTKATGNTQQISIRSLRSDISLDTITLDQIVVKERIGNNKARSEGSAAITIKTLKIESPSLEKMLISNRAMLSSKETLCRNIINEEERLLQSVNHKARPVPANRGELAYWIENNGHVGIP
ncbi:MAG: hypothetical protein WCH05_07120 [Chlorobiaceae bacterium]